MSRHTRHLPPRAEDASRLELEHHLAELVDRLIDEGMDPAAARREAERRFGSPARYRSALERTQRRRTLRASLGAVLADGAGAAMRTVRRSPGFAAAVMVTLGLGIGANATMFAIVDRLLLQPPEHVRDHGRVVRVLVKRPSSRGDILRSATITFPDYQDLRAQKTFEAVAGYEGPEQYTLGRGPEAARVRVIQAAHTLFPLLGVAPALGRFYDADEDRIGATATAVLSSEYWRRSFGADPAVLGRDIEVAGDAYTIIGVAPAGFTGVDLAPVDVWLPLETSQGLMAGTEWHDSRGWYWMEVVARVADGVSMEAAAAEATALHRAGRREDIEDGRYRDPSIELDPLILARGPDAPPESRVARWLGGVSLIVLLIACANVANLLLASGARRRREVAVRLALGVTRARLIAQMVVESVLLALAGGGVALLIAAAGGRLVRAVLLPSVAFSDGLGGRVVAFTLLIAAVAGVVAGLAPAIQGTRDALAGDLAAGARGSARRGRARPILTVLQAALSVVLLVGAGLFVRSVARVRALDLGFDVDRLVMVGLEFDPALIPGMDPDLPPDPASIHVRNDLYQEAMRRVQGLPGVLSVAATVTPLGWGFGSSITVPGLDSIPRLAGGGPYYQDVTLGYARTVGLRVRSGRDFTESDDAASGRVALISETMARMLWPEGDPIGRVFQAGGPSDPVLNPPWTVIGVVDDAVRNGIGDEPFMQFYRPYAQRSERVLQGMYLRTEPGRANEVATAVAPIVRSLDPRVRYAMVQPLREIIDPQARSWTLGATMFTIFGALALVVAAVGLYSVLAFDVAQRTRELGIRTALGAAKGRLLRGVLVEGIALAGLGVALGLLIAVAVAPYARDLLFEVSPRDPAVLVIVAVALGATGVLASLLPALRATRVDPVVALRAE
jgi:predicted permease